jgi:hypothetical protein
VAVKPFTQWSGHGHREWRFVQPFAFGSLNRSGRQPNGVADHTLVRTVILLHIAALSQDAHRHQEVVNELLRRANDGSP